MASLAAPSAPRDAAASAIAADSANASCETAFAYASNGSTCFEDITGTPRWGWSIGPIAEGAHSYDIYAGAGQCVLSKGTKVGTVALDYRNGTAVVAVSMNSGYTLGESHLYMGAAPLPRDQKGGYTVAPGQYPYSHDLGSATSDTFRVTGLSGTPNMVLHLVSCPEGSRTGDKTCTGNGGSKGVKPPKTTTGTDTAVVVPPPPPDTAFAGLD